MKYFKLVLPPVVDGVAMGCLIVAAWDFAGLALALVVLGVALLVLNWRYGLA